MGVVYKAEDIELGPIATAITAVAVPRVGKKKKEGE
jgi:hypothetical protein